VIPLELYPEAVQLALNWTPFPYITFVPVKIFMGTYEGAIGMAALILSVWTLAAGVLASIVWNRGLRLYTAAGM